MEYSFVERSNPGVSMNPLTEHLREVGETYPEHLVRAVGCGATMLAAGFAYLVHALIPFLFVNTASESIRRLHCQMENRRASSRGGCVESTPGVPLLRSGERLEADPG